MKLIIDKFPPITQRCEIDLSKKLTLFVGENNSGKSYISQLIWGIFNKLSYVQSLNMTNLQQISTIFTKHIQEQTVKNVTISSLNHNSQYWLVDTESNAFQVQGKLEKFKNSLSFIYILLHLLDGKANQEINIFGILAAQKEMNWNEKSTLNIFSSTSIRYIKRSFFTQNSEIEIDFSDIIKPKEQTCL